MKYNIKEMAQMIDHTLLKADASNEALTELCHQAHAYDFKMVAINSAPVSHCAQVLKDSDVHVGAAIGFPLGQTTIAAKVFEVKDAIENGADEIDYVINIRELKAGNLALIRDEMQQITDVCHQAEVLSKVILETCYLTDEEKRTVCTIALDVRPDFVKTSTGFGTHGATVEDITLMKSIVCEHVGVKASGGIRDLETFVAMIEAGATRIGTSSGIAIIEAMKAANNE